MRAFGYSWITEVPDFNWRLLFDKAKEIGENNYKRKSKFSDDFDPWEFKPSRDLNKMQMKRGFITYGVFTLLWIAFLLVFNEENISLQVAVRVVSLYIWIVTTVVYLTITIVHMVKHKNTKLSYGVIVLVLINVFVMTMDPFNLITDFLG